jgi:hypothetical protein
VLQLLDVQALLSLQVMVVYTQPVDGLQLLVVQALLSLHVIVVWTQLPFWQESVVQALPSLHWEFDEQEAPQSGPSS